MRHTAAAVLTLSAVAAAQPPAGYYNSVDTSSGATLRTTLHAIIDDHQRYPYTSGGTDTWNILELADQDPQNGSRILDVYRNASYPKAGGANSNYNREHAWPRSHGFPIDSGSNYPFTDCHALFLCDDAYNTARDARHFADGSGSWSEFVTVANGGQGGGSGVFPGNSNWQSSQSQYAWQVWNGRKGDIARAMFYMDVRYEGGNHGGTGAAEPNLILTDNTSLMNPTATNVSVAYMGRLSTLLQWHQDDPIDTREITRNNRVFSFQGNRNPFVDHPEWIDCIYLGQCSTVTPTREPEAWINELHYDNLGADVNEFVEVAGRGGENVDGWLLVAYDGATGQSYAFRNLRGTFPTQQNGYGTLSFSFPDLLDTTAGLALVTSTGVVKQFLSYEGAFTATNGAAKGLTSTDIGVSETVITAVGFSLRLSGTGNAYSEFAWQPPFVETPGAINTNQTIQ